MGHKKSRRKAGDSIAALGRAERLLVRRAVYEHPNAARFTEAEAALAERLWHQEILRPAAVGQRYCWRLHASKVRLRSVLREALFAL